MLRVSRGERRNGWRLSIGEIVWEVRKVVSICCFGRRKACSSVELGLRYYPASKYCATDLILSLKGHWALDPIDGTKGFLRGGQYAVCLGLLVDGQVEVGVMGCPNLPVNPKEPEGEKGVIFVAVKGQGAFQVSLKFCEWYFSDVEVY